MKVNKFFKNRFAVLQIKVKQKLMKFSHRKQVKKVRYFGLKNTCKQIDTCKYEHIKLISKNEKNRKQKLKGGKYQRDNEFGKIKKNSLYEFKRKFEQNIF